MKSPRAKSGIALIIVLLGVALVTVLALAVLTSVGTFSQSTKASTSNSATRSLIDTTVNLVTAQIRDATTLDQQHSWASQPGMIRTYDTSGNQSLLYKLYSSPNMVLDGSQSQNQGANLLKEEAPASATGGQWSTHPGLYTDLNSPVTASDGHTLVFPIIDPRAWSGKPNVPPVPAGAWDHGASWNASTDVQGFAYSDTTADGSTTIEKTVLPTGANDDSARLPMPSQWLYVRKSGFIAAGTETANGISVPADPNFNDPINPDSNPNPNPVVGRIAFWTDDDTCKVNINTACGDLWAPDTFPSNLSGPANPNYGSLFHTAGSYWDIPRFGTWYTQWPIGDIYPLQHEFQRYAGHPATVFLSAVFPQFSASGGAAGSARDDLYSIVPRVNGGTATPGQNTEGGNAVPAAALSNGNYAIQPKHDRLYDSIDELLYTPQRNNNQLVNTAELEKAKFFITADSKAPEVNLFNLPRVSMWPINSTYTPFGSHKCTPYDLLIAYCASLNHGASTPYYYFFQRNNSLDPLSDWGIPRNQALYQYLDQLVGKNIPGFGGSFAGAGGKYSQSGVDQAGNSISEIGQILTEIMDYIRSLNLQDPLLALSQNQFSPQDGSTTTSHDGMVIPLQPTGGVATNTMGFGRFITLEGVGLQFIVTDNPNPFVQTPPGGPYQFPKASEQQSESVCAVLVLRGRSVGGCIPFLQVNGLSLRLRNAQTLILTQGSTTVHLNFPNFGKIVPMPKSFSVTAQDSMIDTYCPGGTLFHENFVDAASSNPIGSRYGDVFMSTSGQMAIPTNAYLNASPYNAGFSGSSTFTMSATTGATQVDLLYNGALIQTITVDLNRFNLVAGSSVPAVWQTPSFPEAFDSHGPDPGSINYTPQSGGGTPTNPNTPLSTRSMSTVPDSVVWDTTTMTGDTLKELVPGYPQLAKNDTHAGSDYRLLAAMKNPLNTYWVPEGYSDQGTQTQLKTSQNPMSISHIFTNDQLSTSANGSIFYGYHLGTLIDVKPNAASPSEMVSQNGYVIGWGDAPAAPVAYLTAAVPFKTGATHDFDQGAGITCDGPFIGQREEVTVQNLGPGANQSPYYANLFSFNYTSGVTANTSGNATAVEFSSPNRLVPSPGVLGSLPTRLAEGIPWQTLLFRPQPDHPGSGGFSGLPGTPYGFASNPNATIQSPPYAGNVVPDHLFLDLFWMPVVEPYAISDTFSTSGKINMNYQIMPFTNIDRATGMEAVLRSQQMGAVPTNQYLFTKMQVPDVTLEGGGLDERMSYMHDIDLTGSLASSSQPLFSQINKYGTLYQFEKKFLSGDIFRSASQICDVYLVPLASQWSSAAPANGFGSGGVDADAYQFWKKTTFPANQVDSDLFTNEFGALLGFDATGDNTREAPYTNIYSLLTTKSNSYTVHMRVQSLQQANTPGRDYVGDAWSDPNSPNGGTDIITGEYRGSASIERFLDSSDPNLNNTDFATSVASGATLSPYYKYRVTSTKQFAP